MAKFDLDKLLEAVSEDSPTGPNMEYELAYTGLSEACQWKDADPDLQVEAKEPNAREVHKAACKLLEQTKDLRVAIQLAFAETKLGTVLESAEAIALIERLLSQYWEGVYPQLDADDDNDPTERVNALKELDNPDFFLRAFKEKYFAEATGLGKFTFRDIDVAFDEAHPLENQSAADKAILQAACRGQETELSEQRLKACRNIVESLDNIKACFIDRGIYDIPPFESFRKLLKRAIDFYQNVLGDASSSMDAHEEQSETVGYDEAVYADEGVPAAPATTRAAPAIVARAGTISSRADAKRQLEQICNFLEKSEPAHPAPLLLRRAIRLLDMDFLAIMEELHPESTAEIKKLAGIRDEDNYEG